MSVGPTASRTEVSRIRSEHGEGGMLNGGEVIVQTARQAHRGRIIEPPTGTPAAYVLMEVQRPGGRTHRRIIFCSAIDWIDPAGTTSE